MAEPDQFALHPPVSPGGVLVCHADDQVLDRCGGRGTPGPAACGVVPRTRDQSAMPGQDRGWRNRKDSRPAAARYEARQCRQPCPVGRGVADLGDLSAQPGILVA
jgi:hypothetical protein